jgi:hypothetical protein
MAKYSMNQKSYKGVQLGRTITAPSKVGSVKGVVEPKDPAGGSKGNFSEPESALTHERIAERAWIIWQKRGCRPGEDERNWNEAETQLRAESDID